MPKLSAWRVCEGAERAPNIIMIQRINLIERAPFQLTYQKLVLGGVLLVFFCIFLYVSQWIGIKSYEHKLERLMAEITRLKEEREKLLRASAPEWNGGPLFELNKVFNESPPWSRLIRDVSLRLPGTVWLTSFRGFNREGANAGKAFVLTGLAGDANDLSQFFNSLADSPLIAKSSLTESKRETDNFNFSIECDMVSKK